MNKSQITCLTKPYLVYLAKAAGKSGEGSEERKNSTSDNGEKSSKIADKNKDRPDKKGGKKKDKNKAPPVEASQPPPMPLVALGKPKDKALKRPRSVGWRCPVHCNELGSCNSHYSVFSQTSILMFDFLYHFSVSVFMSLLNMNLVVIENAISECTSAYMHNVT